MTSIPLRVATVGLLLYSVAAVLGSAANKPDKTLEAIAPYRQWTRVNQRPLPVSLAAVAD